jgi:hypothetical protein
MAQSVMWPDGKADFTKIKVDQMLLNSVILESLHMNGRTDRDRRASRCIMECFVANAQKKSTMMRYEMNHILLRSQYLLKS